MGFKNWIRHIILKESLKEIELDRILDKMSSGKKINTTEQNFLDLFNTIKERDMKDNSNKDYVLLSKHSAYEKAKELIENGHIVICNLADRHGPIGLRIISLSMDWDSEKVDLTLDKGEHFAMEDRYLYNIVNKDSKYSLEAHDEFFEKIPIKE